MYYVTPSLTRAHMWDTACPLDSDVTLGGRHHLAVALADVSEKTDSRRLFALSLFLLVSLFLSFDLSLCACACVCASARTVSL